MEQSEDKVKLILDAAYTLFGTKGFYETKMVEVADAAGIAKGTIYLYFSSKEELFKAITERDFKYYLDNCKYIFNQEVEFEETLLRISKFHITYYVERRALSKLFMQSPNNDPELWQLVSKYIHEYVMLLQHFFAKHRFSNPELIARIFAGILDTVKMEIFFSGELQQDDIDQRAQFLVDIFLNGLNSIRK